MLRIYRNVFLLLAFRTMRKQWIKIDKKIILNYQPDCLSYKGIPVDDFAEPSKIIRTLVIILATWGMVPQQKLGIVFSREFDIILVIWLNAIYSRMNATYYLPILFTRIILQIFFSNWVAFSRESVDAFNEWNINITLIRILSHRLHKTTFA